MGSRSVTHVLHESRRRGFIPAVFKARTRARERERQGLTFEGLYDSLTSDSRSPPRLVSLSLGGESGARCKDEADVGIIYFGNVFFSFGITSSSGDFVRCLWREYLTRRIHSSKGLKGVGGFTVTFPERLGQSMMETLWFLQLGFLNENVLILNSLSYNNVDPLLY